MLKLFHKVKHYKSKVISRDCMNIETMSIISTDSEDTLLYLEEKDYMDVIKQQQLFNQTYF